jgi:ADP-ribose pyrophosphatase YjhB (NUDIX family)
VRETFEETGLEVEPERIVGVYSRPQAAIVVLVFQAAIVGGHMTVTPESLEVRAFPVERIPWSDLAFCTTIWAVRDWVRAARPELDIEAVCQDRLES